jgi:hypothetical protein
MMNPRRFLMLVLPRLVLPRLVLIQEWGLFGLIFMNPPPFKVTIAT